MCASVASSFFWYVWVAWAKRDPLTKRALTSVSTPYTLYAVLFNDVALLVSVVNNSMLFSKYASNRCAKVNSDFARRKCERRFGTAERHFRFQPARLQQWRSQPKSLGRGKSFDFKRATVFCLGHPLSKHKMTKCARHLGGHVSPWLAASRLSVAFACS